MSYVITQNCCNDASCVVACPVGCIHPTPDEPDFGTSEMLYIDAATCIDCGACADACPVEAIMPDTALGVADEWYVDTNAAYYQQHPLDPSWGRNVPAPVARIGADGLRVAIVGSGAAGFYAAKALLRHPGVQVDMYERLAEPHGLIRYGVAPDHGSTKSVIDQFEWARGQQRRFRLHLGVEVGSDIGHDELLRDHHGVVYAHGSTDERRLDIPGEDLPGVHGALSFVGWYNNHPEYVDLAPDLSGRRAVVIGNGNVALDLARILSTDPDDLAGTDIAEHALVALRRSMIDEVVVLGRRGPQDAAFTAPELYGLSCVPGVDVIVDPADIAAVEAAGDPVAARKTDLLRDLAHRPATPGNKRIILRFNAVPEQIVGEGVATGVRVRAGERSELIATTLVLRAAGFRGTELPGLPFDQDTHRVPTVHARVTDPRTGAPLRGVYAAGWIRRGPTGGIGTNRTCAEDAVSALLADYDAGLLTGPPPVTRRRLPLWPVRSRGA
jgi:ferredoxin--NADP+ reductase